MDKLIEKLRQNHKICIAGLSKECKKLAPGSLFVGNICAPCHQVKVRRYHENYTKNHKARLKKVFAGADLLDSNLNKDIDELVPDEEFQPSDEENENENEDEDEDTEEELSETTEAL